MRILFIAMTLLLSTNCCFAQLGGGGGVSGNLWDNWIDDAYIAVNPTDVTKNTFTSYASWDLDPGAGVTQTVNLTMGSESDFKTFTGPDSGNLKAENLDPGEAGGTKTATLFIGDGMTMGLLDSVTVQIPDANEVHYSRAVAQLYGLGPNYKIKYRYIAEVKAGGFLKVRFRVKDDMGNWQTLETESLILSRATKAQSSIELDVDKDWKKNHWLGFSYFDVRFELWNSSGTVMIDSDEGIALVE